MKKIISIVLLMAMLCLAMVSCKKDNPPAETRYTITADEWAALLTLKNYTAESKNEITTSINGGEPESETSTGIIKSTETVWYSEDRGGEDVYKRYTVVEGDKIYSVRENDDGTFWAYTTENGIDTFAKWYTLDEVKFEDLVYNESTKSYSFTVSDEEMDAEYTVWFENGKIVKLVVTASAEYTYGEGEDAVTDSETIKVEVTISNIGTTTVTVPAFEKPAA